MIYRFSTKHSGSGKTIEVQLQAPADAPIDKMRESVRSSIFEQGIEIDSLEYVGSIDTDFDAIVVRKCATEGCTNIAQNAGEYRWEGEYCWDCLSTAMHGWYDPAANGPMNSVCVIQGCGQASQFHLCKEHALPGMVAEASKTSKQMFVVSAWLVEREGGKTLITMSDFAIGSFDGREGFEKRLREKGYQIHRLISDLQDLESVKRENPGIPMEPWRPSE